MVRGESSSTMTANHHAVPIIAQNLAPAETLNQIMDNLNYLSLIMDNAFTSIKTRICSEREKIDLISRRVNKAAEQTELTSKYPNKSTIIYSPATFPESNIINNNYNNDTTTTRTDSCTDALLINKVSDMGVIERPKYKLSKKQRCMAPTNTETVSLLNKLSKLSKLGQTRDVAIDFTDLKGLGTVENVDFIESVSDCLVFDSNVDAYKLDSDNNETNLSGLSGLRDLRPRGKKRQKIAKTRLADAPPSLQKKNKSVMGDNYDIKYNCEMYDVPKYEILSTLPGLSKDLAFDIEYKHMPGTSNVSKDRKISGIAPSNVNFDDLPDLNDFDFGSVDNVANVENVDNSIDFTFLKENEHEFKESQDGGNNTAELIVSDCNHNKNCINKENTVNNIIKLEQDENIVLQPQCVDSEKDQNEGNNMDMMDIVDISGVKDEMEEQKVCKLVKFDENGLNLEATKDSNEGLTAREQMLQSIANFKGGNGLKPSRNRKLKPIANTAKKLTSMQLLEQRLKRINEIMTGKEDETEKDNIVDSNDNQNNENNNENDDNVDKSYEDESDSSNSDDSDWIA